MPSSNQINPFNYNIDNFDSGILGPTTDTDFRTYLFTHNLPVANNVISGVIGGNPWQDRGTEYDISQSNPSVVDVPNLQDVAQTPSLYNNLTNPRQVNLTNNLQNLNPDVQNLLGLNTPIQAGLGQDVTTQFNPTTANVDLPSVTDTAQISSEINNFTLPRYDNLGKNPTPLELLTWYPIEFGVVYNQWAGDYDTSYGVPQALKLGFAGNIESWVQPGGSVTTASEIRDDELFSPLNNKWGPNEMISYSYGADELVNPNTGLIQYSTAVQGDFRDQLLSRSLGVGIIPFSTLGSGINFKPDGVNISELDKIARKRRGDEVKQRIKLNFVDSTVGALNVSPFNLLAGGNLIQQNYSITVPKSGLGKAAQFAADLAGFNLPTSIIPDGAFGIYGADKTIDGIQVDITNDILGYTGSGQKSLLYNALYINKYGPTLESAVNPPTTKLGKIVKEKLGAGQAPNTQNYLTYSPTEVGTSENVKKDSLINSINEKVKQALGKSSANPKDLRSKVFEDISAAAPAPSYGGFYGRFEQDFFVSRSTSDLAGFNGDNEGNGVPIYEDKEQQNLTTYNGTAVEQGSTLPSVTNERFDWRKTDTNPFKKGLLKYTQDLVNNATLTSPAGYIGYFDSDGKTGALVEGAHQTGAAAPYSKPQRPSKGNVARNYDFTNGKGGEYYCRSWSSRRKYHTWDNLIRSDGNWWRNKAENTDMTMNWGKKTVGGNPLGIPKIAWNRSDAELNELYKVVDGKAIRGKVIPYMLSIENLAWKDAPQYSKLPDCEKGPNGGRIMWFPPYDIDFSDSSSLSWDTTSFIGRGENIYTYNHTERTGTLDFKLVVDHPAALNQLRVDFAKVLTDESINSFFAGCDSETLKQLFKGVIDDGVDVPYEEYTEPEQTPITPCEPSPPPYNNIKIYFENARREGASVDGALVIGRDPIADLQEGNYEAGGVCTDPQCGSNPNPPVPSLVNVNPNEWVNDGTKYPCGPAGTGTTYQYLNEGVKDKLIEVAKFLSNTEDGKNYKIRVIGYTSAANPGSLSSQGVTGEGTDEDYNTRLGRQRAINTKKWLYSMFDTYEKPEDVYLEGNPQYGTYPKEADLENDPRRWAEPESKGSAGGPITKCPKDCDDGNPCDPNLFPAQANSRAAKEARYAEIILEPNLDLQIDLLKQVNDQNTKTQKDRIAEENKKKQAEANRIATKFITECDYFEQMKRDQPFVYQTLTEKIKYFHPAFHSTSPEGFNSRLTFLLQCTRQGPQMMDSEVPSNMVFGRPPVCILRIGDFYYTKIIIDNVNITYDPLQWDLNPEGIGVQPMIAKVSIGFKFIGGSSLGGPIRQLQNAVSYNFFANTGVYQPARVLSEETGKRLKFIYGAFLTPDEADSAYAEVAASIVAAEQKSSEENKESVNTNAESQAAPIEQDTQQQIEENIPKDDTKATEGDNKSPTAPQPPTSDEVTIELKTSDASTPIQNTAYGFTNSSQESSTGSIILVNIQKPNGKYNIYQITDKRKNCCSDSNPGFNKEPIGISGIKITPSTGTKITYDPSEECLNGNCNKPGNLKDGGNTFDVANGGRFSNGQISVFFTTKTYYSTPLDYNNNVINTNNNTYWSGDGNFDIEVIYNPGKNPDTGFQQEVVLRSTITLPKT